MGPNRKANWCESDPVCELDLVKRSGVGSYVVGGISLSWPQGPLYVLGSGAHIHVVPSMVCFSTMSDQWAFLSCLLGLQNILLHMFLHMF